MTLVQTEPKSIKIWSTAVKRVTMWPNGTEKQIRPGWWQPWANTVAYYPLDTNFNDFSWNWYNLSKGSWTFITTLSWVGCASFNGEQNQAYAANSSVPAWNTNSALAWVYCTRGNYTQQWVLCSGSNSDTWEIRWMGVVQNKAYVTDWKTFDAPWTSDIYNGWHLICFTRTSGQWIKLYVDGSLETTSTVLGNRSATWLTIWAKSVWWPYLNHTEPFKWYISNVIFENKIRTATEILDYYNNTKSNYWL